MGNQRAGGGQSHARLCSSAAARFSMMPATRSNEVVERGDPPFALSVEQRVFLAVGSRIPDQRVEDQPGKEVANVEHRDGGPFAQHGDAVAQARFAFLLVLPFWRKPHGLAEILLVQPSHRTVRADRPVVTLDDTTRRVPDPPNGNRGNLQADCFRQRHAEDLGGARQRCSFRQQAHGVAPGSLPQSAQAL